MTDPIVADYLDRLYRCALVLPVDRRVELVDEIAAHIGESLGPAPTEAEVRNLLERLGDPEEIVAAAGEDLPPADAGHEYEPARATREAVAVGLLTLGSLVPVLGWLAGVVVAWTSARWRTWHKMLLTLVIPGGPGLALWIALVVPGGSESCSGGTTYDSDGTQTELPTVCTHSGLQLNPALALVLLLVCLTAPVVVGLVVFRVAARRAATEPSHRVLGAGTKDWGAQEIAAVALLTAGGFVAPVVGPIVGLVLAATSRAWTQAEKTVAAVLACGGLALGAVLGVLVFSL